MSALSLSVPENISLYQTDYRGLLRDALFGGALGQQLQGNRLQALKAVMGQCPVHFASRVRLMLERLTGMDLDTSSFSKLEDGLSPFPLFPAFLRKEMPLRASAFIEKCFADSPIAPIVHAIIERSEFRSGDVRYRTDIRDDKIFIGGDDGTTLMHYAGIAHELGHALYETKYGQGGSLSQIYSEAAALLCEESLVASVLETQEDQRAWHAHQRHIDLLNYCMFLVEAADLGFRLPVRHQEIATAFSPSLMPLRETMFTAVGYQLIYAEASWIRSKRDVY